MRAALAAVAFFAALPARADGLGVELAIPAQARYADACLLLAGPCGKLDEDGQLPLRFYPPRGARVVLDGRPVGSVAVLDVVSLLRDQPAGVITSGMLEPIAIDVELESARGSTRVTLRLEPTERLFRPLRRRLAASASLGVPWLTDYDPTHPGRHPIVVFKIWRGRRGNLGADHDDLGRQLAS
jgi:hypothetical protein